MRLWQKILVVLAVLMLGLVGFVATRPEQFSLSRSIEVAAPADKVYALVADFHEWPKWSPWEKKDLAMKKQYSGAASGVGQIYEWQGNKDVGKGRMTVMSLDPGKAAVVKLEFLDPGPFENVARFDISAQGDKTHVTWTLEGKSEDFMTKAFSLGMDAMVGPDFEAGLKNIKAVVEAK